MSDFENNTAILLTGSRALSIGLSSLLLSIPPIERVECLSDSESLVQRLGQIEPILIILDTGLPGIRAAEISKAIRTLAPHALRILLSENMAEYRELVETGEDTVIVKGAEPAKLARALEQLLLDHLVA